MTDVDDAPATTGTDGTRLQVHDLRSALELLKQIPGQYHETDHPVQPIAQLAGVYKKIGAGGTVSRPTKLGPAMMFNDVEGYPGWRVLVGLMASRDRVGMLLDCPPRELTQRMGHALASPIPPVDVGAEKAARQEVVHRSRTLESVSP
jgi:4-hydroxy-3-polyprenylbenzoate decarboxylase